MDGMHCVNKCPRKDSIANEKCFVFFGCCCCCFSASLYLLVILPHTHKMENSSQIGETLKRLGRENNLYPKYENNTICFKDIG